MMTDVFKDNVLILCSFYGSVNLETILLDYA